jgi:hypothetical protein
MNLRVKTPIQAKTVKQFFMKARIVATFFSVVLTIGQ